MATRSKAGQKPAESKAKAPKPQQAEDPSKALKDKLDADTTVKSGDDEQPVAITKAEGDEKQEAPKRQPLALSEIRGEVKDGDKIYIGVEIWGGANKGGTSNAPFYVPKRWEICGPAARRSNVHARDLDRPETTLCRLPTNWTSGVATYDDDEFLTCEPCARRLIAVKKLTQEDHDKRRKAKEDAREAALKALAERKQKEKEAKDAKAKEEADKAKAKAAEAEKPVEPPKAEATPDPKPAKTTRRRRPKAA